MSASASRCRLGCRLLEGAARARSQERQLRRSVGRSRKQLRQLETAASTGEERGGRGVAEMAVDWLGVALLGKDAERLRAPGNCRSPGAPAN